MELSILNLHLILIIRSNQSTGTNKLDGFSRSPLDHRRYLEWSWNTKNKYESVMEFVRTQRVQWPKDIKPKSPDKPFQEPGQ